MTRSALPRFAPAELIRFLSAIDAALSRRVFVTLIGGGAAALGYGVVSGTKDLDTLTELTHLEEAIRAARRATGLDVPIEMTTVADLPYEFESRLLRVLPTLRQLEIFIPEAHDLALSKLARANAGDISALEDMHARHPLSFDVLLERYRTEMTHAIGDPARLDQNFLLGVHVLFGELRRENARQLLRRARP